MAAVGVVFEQVAFALGIDAVGALPGAGGGAFGHHLTVGLGGWPAGFRATSRWWASARGNSRVLSEAGGVGVPGGCGEFDSAIGF